MSDIALQISGIPYKKYYALCKPKVVFLIVFTAVVGMLLATKGALPLDKFFLPPWV